MTERKTSPRKPKQQETLAEKAHQKETLEKASPELPQEQASVEIKAEPAREGRKTFPVVGIGASAGGLEALETFFTHMPATGNMAFVIIQHLSPDHKSIMGQILKKDTRMPVLEIQDGMEPELNCVYFNPPNREVAIYQGVFHLVEPAETRYSRLPIDYFFRSLAQDLEEKAICIVLVRHRQRRHPGTGGR